MPSMYQGVPYIAFQRVNERSNPCQMSRIHVKENSKRIWTYAHIPMYTVIGVKLVYVHGYRVKSRVYNFLYNFRDDQGSIKG